MDYKKIGKFIQEKRKELELTQKDLAEKMNLTDRAISRWERGIGCPDIGLIERLAEILQVSVLEILHGEKIEKNENEVVVKVLKEDAKKIRVWKFVSFTCLNVLLALLIFYFVIIYIFPNAIKRDNSLHLYVVESGSMVPTFNYNDVAIFKDAKIYDVQVGDIVLFNFDCEHGFHGINDRILPTKYDSNLDVTSGSIIAHRVIEKRIDENGTYSLKTRGDNKIKEDCGFVNEDNFIGVFVKRVPKIGKYYFGNNPRVPRVNKFVIFFTVLGIISILFIDIIQILNLVKRKFL